MKDILKIKNYPEEISKKELIQLLKDILEDINIKHLENESEKWILKEISLNNVNNIWQHESNIIREYRYMNKRTRPPIICVFESNKYTIIDGSYRASAAIQNNELTILAYVNKD